MNRRGWIAAVAVVVLGGLAAWCGGSRASDVRARVTNRGATSLRDVQAVVTGGRHSLGDLAPGASAACALEPSGESALEIRWLDAAGVARASSVDCYFEPRGYEGSIDVQLDGDLVASAAVDVRLR